MDRWERWSRLGMKITGVTQTITGVSAALAPGLFSRLFHGHDVTSEPLLLRLHLMVWLFVAALGLSYAHAGWSQAPVSRSTLVAASVGKGVAVGLWLEMMTQGLGTVLMPGAIAFDAVLSALFFITLVRSRRTA
jgi:hypothetical protein